jgi:lipoprotein-anchoring transpeptidase ErfK/SrfK
VSRTTERRSTLESVSPESAEALTVERLARALKALDPADRGLLDLSLRHRIPDDELAEVLRMEPQEVARRRVDALKSVSEQLNARDVGGLATTIDSLLTLPPEAWGVPPLGRRRRQIAMAAGAVAAVAAAVLAVVLLSGGDDPTPSVVSSSAAPPGADARESWEFVPEEGQGTNRNDDEGGYVAARLTSTTVLRSRPGGRALARVTPKSEWGSRRVLSVVERRGRWLAVLAPQLDNGETGWIPASKTRLRRLTYSVHSDLSSRVLVVRRGKRVVRRMRVAIGASGTPTPTGRFAVTDKLNVTDTTSPYGCCVVALTGHQQNLPANWTGGDRLAIHATSDPTDIGKGVSAGCLRGVPSHLRWLINRLPIGTPVFIRS